MARQLEASLRGMVEVQSASSVGQGSLQEVGEKGGPWPFILWMNPHDAEKATLFEGLLFWKEREEKEGGCGFVNCFECCL